MKVNVNLFLGLLFLVSVAGAQSNTELKFDKNNRFKIVQFTDTHIDVENSKNLEVYQTVETVIKIEKPDFIIFTGDIMTQRNPQAGYELLIPIIQKYKIPWAVVFGNHESESNTTRKELAAYVQDLPYCLNNDDGSTDGNSNFVLEIKGKSGKTGALLYCMDSNSYSTLKPKVEGYGWFTFGQINWYRQKSKAFTRANGGNPLPALAFFHIPLPEYTAAWNNQINPPVGVKNEDECSPDINTGMFSAMLESGDVMGTFVGHDHINDYIGVHYGMALAYGRVTKIMKNPEEDPLAGGRVIVLTKGKRIFDTWIRDMNGKKELECSWPGSFSKSE
uniref:metallophosphoesterase family protein n=1 Tax=uncultured Draconibacterium sp. TaxID=1573823 RepID=UPI003216D4DE